jgi:predicted nucleic acid-binding Zn ribbon protein
VADSLERVARRMGAPRPAVAAVVFSRWEELVGADIAAHSKPLSLKEGVLVLAVDHPAWAAQLAYMTAEILERIAGAAGPGAVGEIRLRVTT